MKYRYLIHIGVLIFTLSCKGGRTPSSTNSCVKLLRQVDGSVRYRTDNIKFNKFFLNFDPKPYIEKTVGFESEFLVPQEMGLFEAATFIKSELDKASPERFTHISLIPSKSISLFNLQESLRVSYIERGIKKIWEIKPEPSVISPSTKYNVIEITSPIMSTPQEIDVFIKMMSKFKDNAKAIPFPQKAGIHLHYGIPDIDEHELKLIYWIVWKLEKDLTQFFNKLDTRMNTHLLSEMNEELYFMIKNKHNNINLGYAPFHNHNYILFHNRKYKTLEFRITNGSLEPESYNYTYEIFSKIVDAVRTHNPTFLDYISGKHKENNILKLIEIGTILNIKATQSSGLTNITRNEMRALK